MTDFKRHDRLWSTTGFGELDFSSASIEYHW